MQQTILAIAGKPGLYKLVTRGHNNLIVEALDATHKRLPAFATDRITSLSDIAMFTETDDVPLMEVLENMKPGTTSSSKPASPTSKIPSPNQKQKIPPNKRDFLHVWSYKKLLEVNRLSACGVKGRMFLPQL